LTGHIVIIAFKTLRDKVKMPMRLKLKTLTESKKKLFNAIELNNKAYFLY